MDEIKQRHEDWRKMKMTITTSSVSVSDVVNRESAERAWTYDNSTGDEDYDNTKSCVKEVQFNISRYGKFKHRIVFDNPVTVRQAVREVEWYLSQPLTQDYYEPMVWDTFHEMSWEEASKSFKWRGDCLTSARYLEGIDVSSKGIMTLAIGS
jgi:hypothetical protein